MSAFRDAFSRRRQELNPLTTSLGPAQQPYPTPISAAPISAVTLSTPFGHLQQAYTPLSAVRQYNPQQWGQSPIGTENSIRFPPLVAQEVEAAAPPPYSPPRSNRPAGSSPEEQQTPAPVAHRPSPESQSVPSFPPPPGGHSRVLSRDRSQPLFGLGALSRGRPAVKEPSGLSLAIGGDQVTNSDSGSSSRRPVQPSVEPLRQAEEFDCSNVRPPASRRAASTGAISTPPTSLSQGSSTARWEPGMPLPPPPPGPPPQSGSRSQSLTRAPDPIVSPPTRRPQPISNLGPIPPTPAGWMDDSVGPRPRSPNPGLRIDTSTPPASSTASELSSNGSSAGLMRSRAMRGEPKSIRERRSESRHGRVVPLEEPSNNPWADAITPADITVPMTVLGRRLTINKSTPRSARPSQSQLSADTPSSTKRLSAGAPAAAPLAAGSRCLAPHYSSSSNHIEAPTPPFSPDPYQAPSTNGSPPIPPKSLPTPPPQSRRSTSSTRPAPHALAIIPINDGVIPAPLSSSTSTNVHSPTGPYSPSSFCQSAIVRHNAFAESEAAATTDGERVRLFADFIVSESRLRRERYASAIDAMGLELLELTRDLFRPYTRAQRESAKALSKRSSNASDSQPDRRMLSNLQTSSAPTSAPSSASEFPSPADMGRDNSYHSYRPSLSPIASMAASEAPDESSSRGRPSSRWWELSQPDARSPTRSKRESKYMGVPKEARESLQWEGDNHPSSSSATASYVSYGPNEHLPEKAGWNYGPSSSPGHGKTPTGSSFATPSPAPPATPNPRHLDVSRLVTLPPPYPRHHPAVNNNHPDLTDIRTSVRALSDLSEVEATKERFRTRNNQLSEDAASAAAKRRQSLRAHIQREIEAGAMSYADAAKLEAESTANEAETTKSKSKASFDLFQSSVVTPINDLLMDRIHRATVLFEQLRSKLFADAQQESPNIPQEEGDEQPELLEKLTLLKWVFEARETLHRDVYDLLSDRNDMYRDMVTEPYRLAGNEAKVANAEQFFAQDALKRKVEFETEALGRTMEFMDIVESNVLRGVEVQLSAFWDIAPPLRQITDKVPKTLTRDFGVVIPREEYDENPEYTRFPLQYLYHLLQHGEKSTYQFIESQVNLLCLLHEVKSAVAAVKGRVDLAEAAKAGDQSTEERVRAEMERDERRLTDDLKEKVRCVEDQWASSLGKEFEAVKERVKLYLMNEGGWEGVED